MNKTKHVESYSNVGGNYFDKHNSKNILVKKLMKNFYKTFIEVLKKEQFSSLVDVGCGEGHLTNILQIEFGKNCSIDAFEYESDTVKRANKLYPKLNIRQGDIRTLVVNKEHDVLIASEVLEHIPDVENGITHCKSLAKVCVFSVPNTPRFCLANIMRLKYLSSLGRPPGHIHLWSSDSFKGFLSKYFSSVEIKTTGVWTVAVCRQD